MLLNMAIHCRIGGRHVLDRIIDGFTTTCVLDAYHH